MFSRVRASGGDGRRDKVEADNFMGAVCAACPLPELGKDDICSPSSSSADPK